jgi:hypothetical protein
METMRLHAPFAGREGGMNPWTRARIAETQVADLHRALKECQESRERHKLNEKALDLHAAQQRRALQDCGESRDRFKDLHARAEKAAEDAIALGKQIQAELEAEKKHTADLTTQYAIAAAEVMELRQTLGFLDNLAQEPPSMSQMLGALSLADDGTPWWRAVVQLLRNQMTEETNNTLVPGLTSEAAHYNRGRAAALYDHLETLLALRAKAQRPPESGEGK